MVPAKLLEKQFGWVGAGGEQDKANPEVKCRPEADSKAREGQ